MLRPHERSVGVIIDLNTLGSPNPILTLGQGRHDRDLRVDGSLCASSGHSLSTTGHISSETHAAKRKIRLLDCVSRLVEHGI
jgi:hypothetical protein